MEGKFVRAAYNNEGYVILGYQLANRSLGEQWMLLEVGMTVRDGVPNYEFNRAAVSLETPDGKTHPAAVQSRNIARPTPGRCSSGNGSSATRSTTSRPAPPGHAGSPSSPTWKHACCR